MNETIKNILERRTVRAYKDSALSEETLKILLECAMYAPSARNLQPCHVRVLTDKAALDNLNTDFKNKVGWKTPAYTKWDVNPVYQGAPALFIIYGETESPMDAGIMAENICIAAESLGLGSCIIGSIGALLSAPEGEKWKEKLEIPASFKFLVSVAVGEKNEEPPLKSRNRTNFRIIEKI